MEFFFFFFLWDNGGLPITDFSILQPMAIAFTDFNMLGIIYICECMIDSRIPSLAICNELSVPRLEFFFFF